MERTRPEDFDTPVLLVIFNRPETTRRVMDVVRQVAPRRLFVTGDGPRPSVPADTERCAAARALARPDWDCEVRTRFLDSNLGCKLGVSSGVGWFFDQVEEGIILEDDTVPHLSFFRYCAELLARYRHDARIGMISGDNFAGGFRRSGYSYYFSRYTHIWGWASWRRAWKDYDVDLRLWPEIRSDGWAEDLFPGRIERAFWTTRLDAVARGEIDTWDHQWSFANLVRGRLAVMPSLNLVSNIGVGEGATHMASHDPRANLRAFAMDFPLLHPPFVVQDRWSDEYSRRAMDVRASRVLRDRLKRLLPRPVWSALRSIKRALVR